MTEDRNQVTGIRGQESGAKEETLAWRIRGAIYELAKIHKTFAVGQIFLYAKLQARADERRAYTTLRDLCRSGEIKRVTRGIYALLKTKARKRPPIQDKMWQIVRMRRVVSDRDLAELAGASLSYAKEYMALLVRRSICRRLEDGRVQLIDDPGPAGGPNNTEKAAKLRAIRAEKKGRLAAKLKLAQDMLDEAGKLLEELN